MGGKKSFIEGEKMSPDISADWNQQDYNTNIQQQVASVGKKNTHLNKDNADVQQV